MRTAPCWIAWRADRNRLSGLFMPNMPNILLIGYGNRLRGDDSVGPRVAETIGDLNWPGVKAQAVHQLVPELAEDIAAADEVIFVDAKAGAESVQVDRLEPEPLREFSTHRSEPRELLALTRGIYGKCPLAWCVSVPAQRFEFTEALTALARRGVEEAVVRIRDLCSLRGGGFD